MKKLFLFCVLFSLCRVCLADTIYLNDGQVFRGEIISQDEGSIVVQTYDGDEETIDRRYVARVVMNDNYRAYRRRMRTGYESEGQWISDEWIFKLGVDFNGKHETSNSNLFIQGSGNSSLDGTSDTSSGMSFGGEYVTYVTKRVGLGGGITFQSARGLSDVSGNFSFTPLYGLIKLRTDTGRNNSYEYLIGQLGYNFFSGDQDYRGMGGVLDGGLYFGVGAGVAINRVQIELLYTEDRGTARDSGYLFDTATNQNDIYFNESGNIKYSKLGINVGFLF